MSDDPTPTPPSDDPMPVIASLTRLKLRQSGEGQPGEPGDKTEQPRSDEQADAEVLVRHRIQLTERNIHIAVPAAMKALADKRPEAKVFQRSGRLMRPVIDEPVNAAPVDGKPRSTQTAALIDLDPGYLELLLREHMDWERFKKGKPVPAGPGPIPRLILASRGNWPFPVLDGLIPTPTLRPDGSLLIDEGYDAATNLYLINPPAMPAINLHPTREDAETALALLNGLLDEFPFVNDASRSVALSEIISVVARGALDLVPLHMIKAPTAGTGKSYLNDCVSYIVLGQPCPVIAATSDHEELEKRIGSAMISAYPIIALDNLNGVLDSNLLCQAVTQPVVIYRPLGKSVDIRIKCQASTILATGNNIRICDDLGRRTLLAQMDVGIERPWTRTFARSPIAEIADDRGHYIAAALTIPLAYLAAGAPNQSVAPVNGFDAWSRLVRSPLIWLGCADPALTFEAALDDDPKRQAKIQLFIAWIEFIGAGKPNGCTCARLIEAANDISNVGPTAEPKRQALKAALMNVAPAGAKDISPRHLGNWLRAAKGTIAGGMKLCGKDDRTGKAVWWIEKLEQRPGPQALNHTQA